MTSQTQSQASAVQYCYQEFLHTCFEKFPQSFAAEDYHTDFLTLCWYGWEFLQPYKFLLDLHSNQQNQDVHLFSSQYQTYLLCRCEDGCQYQIEYCQTVAKWHHENYLLIFGFQSGCTRHFCFHFYLINSVCFYPPVSIFPFLIRPGNFYKLDSNGFFLHRSSLMPIHILFSQNINRAYFQEIQHYTLHLYIACRN